MNILSSVVILPFISLKALCLHCILNANQMYIVFSFLIAECRCCEFSFIAGDIVFLSYIIPS